MVTYCIVWCCKSRGYVKGLRYFGVTKRRMCAWMQALNRDTSNTSRLQKICSLHFLPDDYYLKNGQQRLKPTAVPSIYLTPSSNGVQMELTFARGNYSVATRSLLELGIDPLRIDPFAPSSGNGTEGSAESNAEINPCISDQVVSTQE